MGKIKCQFNWLVDGEKFLAIKKHLGLCSVKDHREQGMSDAEIKLLDEAYREMCEATEDYND